MKVALAVVVLCGMAVGQNSVPCSTIPGTHECSTLQVIEAPPAKRCAFDLKPQSILAPPTLATSGDITVSAASIWCAPNGCKYQPAKKTSSEYKAEMFPQPPKHHTKLVCPYERAIELFGEDRVRYDDAEEDNGHYQGQGCRGTDLVRGDYHCIGKSKRVLVDGEVVYEEKP